MNEDGGNTDYKWQTVPYPNILLYRKYLLYDMHKQPPAHTGAQKGPIHHHYYPVRGSDSTYICDSDVIITRYLLMTSLFNVKWTEDENKHRNTGISNR